MFPGVAVDIAGLACGLRVDHKSDSILQRREAFGKGVDRVRRLIG